MMALRNQRTGEGFKNTLFSIIGYYKIFTIVPYAIHCFPGSSDGKASAYNEGDLGLIPGLGRSPGEGNVDPLQDYCLENPWTEEPGRLQSMEFPRPEYWSG